MLKYCRYGIGFLIGTNIYIALISTALAFTGFIIFNKRDVFISSMFVFFATQTAYNLQRFFKWRKNIIHPFLIPYLPPTLNQWYLLIALSGTGLAIFTFFISINQLLLLCAVGGVTSAYIFVNPITKTLSGLRYVPFLKTFLVSICWTTLFFLLTFDTGWIEMLRLTWIFWLVVFLEILKACVLFDLRDLDADEDDVRTFANTFKSKGVFVLWLMLTLIIAWLVMNNHNYMLLLAPFVLVAIIQVYCIFQKPGELVFTFVVDGSLILSALLNYLAFTNA